MLGVRRRGFSTALAPGRASLDLIGRFAIAVGTSDGSSSSNSYWWDELDDDFVIDPARSTDGTGSTASPFQMNQVLMANGSGGNAVNPNGQRVIFRILPGNCDYTDPRASSFRAPYWRPRYGGTAANPVIFRGTYNPADPSVSSANYSSFRRIGGLGSILGSGDPALGTNYVYFDKINIPTWAGSAGTNSEVFMYAIWASTGCKGIRLRLDGESAGAITVPSNNYGAVWHQNTTDCEIADCLIQNIGSTGGTQIWSAAEHYATRGLNMHHNDFYNIRGQGIFEKGEGQQTNIGNRYHHNRLREVRGNNSAIFQFVHETGTSLANASWWYQNLVHDCDLAVKTNAVSGFQQGIVLANNTFAQCGNGIYVNNFSHQPLWVMRNNIWYDTVYSYYPEDGSGWTSYDGGMDVDRNRHYAQTAVMLNDGAKTMAQVQDLYGVDENGQQSNPGFFDVSVNDFRRTFDQLGTDYLSLLGGPTSAAINQGCYITSDMSDQIGRRY